MSKTWPGAKEPGESEHQGGSPSRRRTRPPGVPEPEQWGPREPGSEQPDTLALVLPALVPLLKPGGALLMLIKPQFELQPGQVGKRGIVTDSALYEVVEKRIRDCCAELGLEVKGWYDSPVTGGDGNREFFVYAIKEGT